MDTGNSFTVIKRSRYKSRHLTLPYTKVKAERSYISTPLYVFMTESLIIYYISLHLGL